MNEDEFEPTPAEISVRDEVLERIRQHTRAGTTIPLDRASGRFSGCAGAYSYIFEGEDDLLHLAVRRMDGAPLELEETGPVAKFLLDGVPEAMIWMRPGEEAHHYYLGHDLLLQPL